MSSTETERGSGRADRCAGRSVSPPELALTVSGACPLDTDPWTANVLAGALLSATGCSEDRDSASTLGPTEIPGTEA